MTGYIKLFRKLTEWEWYTDGDTLRVFLHLLLKANHKDHTWMGEVIHMGQCITGRKELAKELKMSEARVRTSLNHLKSTSEITIKSTNKYSLITIENWALYQLYDGDLTSKSTSNLTNNSPATNQQLTTNKNDKNDKKEKNFIKRELKEKDDVNLFQINHDRYSEIMRQLKGEI